MEPSRCLSPALAFFRLFGFVPLKPRSGRLNYFGVMAGVAVFTAYCIILGLQMAESKVKSHRMNTVVNDVQLGGFAASAVVNLGFSWRNLKNFAAMFDCLATFDVRLRLMGTAVQYGHCRVFGWVVMLLATAVLVYIAVFDYYVQNIAEKEKFVTKLPKYTSFFLKAEAGSNALPLQQESSQSEINDNKLLTPVFHDEFQENAQNSSSVLKLEVDESLKQVVLFRNQLVLHWLAIYVSAALNVLNTCQICVFSHLFRRCFDGLLVAVQASARNLAGVDHHKQLLGTGSDAKNQHHGRLRDIEAAFFVLKSGCDRFGLCFGVQNAVNFCTVFVVTTAQLYYVINVQVNRLIFVTMVNWLVLYLGQAVLIVFGYSGVTNAADSIGRKLYEVSLGCKESMSAKIFGLVQKLTYNPVTFSAADIFGIDLPLLHGMVSSVATYIIILIQFRGTDPQSKAYGAKEDKNMDFMS